MLTGNRSWIQKVVECVHEDTRDARKKERYASMILTWAEGMAREGRWKGIQAQDFLRQEHPDWTQNDIATEVRKREHWGGKPVLEHRIDSIAITTHATTPLEKKYATLGAIHDVSKHCHYPLSPWNRKPFKNPFLDEATDQDGEDCAARKFYLLLQEDVANLTDDDRSGIEKMLADVAADSLAEGKEKAGSESDGRNGGKTSAEQYTPPQTEGGSRLASALDKGTRHPAGRKRKFDEDDDKDIEKKWQSFRKHGTREQFEQETGIKVNKLVAALDRIRIRKNRRNN